MADITKDQVVDFIANMSVLEMSELVKEMEEKFGVSAAAAALTPNFSSISFTSSDISSTDMFAMKSTTWSFVISAILYL